MYAFCFVVRVLTVLQIQFIQGMTNGQVAAIGSILGTISKLELFRLIEALMLFVVFCVRSVVVVTVLGHCRRFRSARQRAVHITHSRRQRGMHFDLLFQSFFVVA